MNLYIPCCSVAHSCSTLCNSMDLPTRLPCPSPSPSLLKFMSIASVMPSSHLMSFSPSPYIRNGPGIPFLNTNWTELHAYVHKRGFPDSSVSQESTCNAGDSSSIPGLGRSAGEGIGYPLQYSWAAIVTQLVKNPPTMWETWVWSLGWQDPLEKGRVTHSSILAWKIPWNV